MPIIYCTYSIIIYHHIIFTVRKDHSKVVKFRPRPESKNTTWPQKSIGTYQCQLNSNIISLYCINPNHLVDWEVVFFVLHSQFWSQILGLSFQVVGDLGKEFVLLSGQQSAIL